MLMTEIKRERFDAETVDNRAPLLALAESARAVLGYDVLAKKVEKSAATAVSEESELRAVLAALEIDILNERDVVRYQKERLIERTTELMQEWMEKTAKRSFEECREYSFDQFGGPCWRMETIKEYRQPIPEFVLAKAVQIKERMPECEIYIEHLEDHPDPFLIVGSSKAQYSWKKPAEYYYVEAWAEPKFEGRIGAGGGGEASDDIPF